MRLSLRQRPIVTAMGFGLAHALLMTASMPPLGLGFLSLVAITPLCMLASRTTSPLAAAIGTAIATMPMWLFLERWLTGVTLVGYPLVAIYLSIYPALLVFIIARAKQRGFMKRPLPSAILAGVVWTGLETLRGNVVFGGYPWFLLAHPTLDWFALASLASLVGTYGVSFLVAISGALVAQAAASNINMKRRLTTLAIAAVWILAANLTGIAVRKTPAGAPVETFRIGVVQTNVPQSNKTNWTFQQRIDDFRRFVELTQAVAADAPDLIVWPETMYPGMALNADAAAIERSVFGPGASVFYDGLLALQRQVGAPMLVGALAREGFAPEPAGDGLYTLKQRALYNSVFLVRKAHVDEHRYDKLHLTPFGEVMPYISWSPWLESRLLAIGASGMSFDLDAGVKPTVFNVQLGAGSGGEHARTLRIATPICFEATSPGLCRSLVFKRGVRRADLLVNLTNDGWFGRFRDGHEQHLLAARWRCVELATPMIRVANTGISCLIGPDGRIIAPSPGDRKTGVNAEAALLFATPVQTNAPATLYARTGDLAGWTSLILTLIMGAIIAKPAGSGARSVPQKHDS